MASKVLLLACIGFACIIYAEGQGPLQVPGQRQFGVGSQSQYAVLRTYGVNVVAPFAAAIGALIAQEQLESDKNTFKAVTSTTTTLPNGANGCPANWHLFNGFCYVVTDAARVWLQTRDQCLSMGAYLADIVDQAELNNLRDNVLQQVPPELIYFGLNDHIEEGNLINDIVNEEPRLLNFIAGPNVFGPTAGDCGVIRGDVFSTVPCVQFRKGLCKRRQNSVLTYTGL